MRDFSEFNSNLNEINKRSGMKIFEKQLKSLEGADIKIDEIPYRGIILNHLNDMSESKEDRGLNVQLDTPVKQGSYVIYNEEVYLVVSDIDNHHYYKTVTLRKCNQTVNLKGWDKPIPCWGTNTSYGVKGEIDTNFFTIVDGKIQFKVQKNKYTDMIQKGTRFMFNHSKKFLYKVVECENILNQGVYTITVDKDVNYSVKDDLVNNIAYNEYLETETPVNPNPNPSNPYNIIADSGDLSLKRYNPNTFRVVDSYGNNVSGTWTITIDYNGVPESNITIKETGANYIKLINNKGYNALPIKITFKKNTITLTQTIRLVN